MIEWDIGGGGGGSGCLMGEVCGWCEGDHLCGCELSFLRFVLCLGI